MTVIHILMVPQYLKGGEGNGKGGVWRLEEERGGERGREGEGDDWREGGITITSRITRFNKIAIQGTPQMAVD